MIFNKNGLPWKQLLLDSIIVKQFDDYQEEFNVWFDGSVAITQPPPEPPKPPPVYEYVYEDDVYCTRHLGFTTY